MTESELFEGVAETIRLALVTGPIPITPETEAAHIDGWDSLSHTVIMIMLERKYNITLSEDESNSPNNVGELTALIAGKIGQ